MRWLFRPAATLLGRLRYAHKFVMVGLVLLLPLGFVAKAYGDLQDGQIAHSAKERVGVAYMAPLVELTAMAVAARHEVSTGAELGLVEVGAGIARVEEADRRHGAALGVGREWAAPGTCCSRPTWRSRREPRSGPTTAPSTPCCCSSSTSGTAPT
jgi:methyl-accepting chemotaxis protein